MGCASSRAEHSPAVSLCRDRVTLIRDATQLRYSLAAAHSAYFRSLSSLADALLNFALEQNAATSASSSPTITLPLSTKSESNGLSNGTSSTSTTTLPSDVDSHIHISDDSDIDGGGKSKNESNSSSARETSPTPHYYMKSIPTIVSTVYIAGGSGGSRRGTEHFMRSTAGVPYTIYEDPYGQSWYGVRSEPAPPLAPQTPPPPEAAGGSAWDFLNPFHTYEQFMQGYSNENYGMLSSVASSPASSSSSSEVRQREGIPPLEEETEPEFEQSSSKTKGRKKVAEFEEIQKKRSINSNSNTTNSVDKEESSSKRKSSSSESGNKKSNGEESSLKSKIVSFEEISLATEESKVNGGAGLVAVTSRDAVDAVAEIKERFKLAAEIGDEVAEVLEAWKLPYRSRRKAFRVISSRILDPVAHTILACSRPSHTRSQHSTSSLKHSKYRNTDSIKYKDFRSGSLSSTLDKLYVCEKKLLKEIKDEEKLRIFYEKKRRRLKDLDDRGAEAHEIDSVRASLRKLQTKIIVAMKSVDAMSKRIHKLRDEELQPKLVELFQRTMGMWKSLLDCHRNQLKAIVGSKNLHLVARTEFEKISAAKASMELELELLNWCSCFSDWIKNQKGYFKALNGWLIKWLPQEQEVTPDGVAPFSPSRIGAPPAFIISNDWCSAIENISEKDVTNAIQKFAMDVHRLWEFNINQQHEQSKAEYLSRDFARRLKSLQKEFDINGYLAIVSASEPYHDDGTLMGSMKQRLDEEKARQAEIMKQSSLRGGLVPILQALENFASDTVKSFEGLRILTKRQGA